MSSNRRKLGDEVLSVPSGSAISPQSVPAGLNAWSFTVNSGNIRFRVLQNSADTNVATATEGHLLPSGSALVTPPCMPDASSFYGAGASAEVFIEYFS